VIEAIAVKSFDADAIALSFCFNFPFFFFLRTDLSAMCLMITIRVLFPPYTHVVFPPPFARRNGADVRGPSRPLFLFFLSRILVRRTTVGPQASLCSTSPFLPPARTRLSKPMALFLPFPSRPRIAIVESKGVFPI